MSVAIWVGYPRSYTPGRVRPAQYVVLHYTAGSEGPTSAENGAQYDKTRTDGTSTHYFTDSDGPALQEVPEGDRSHAALYHGNEIGIQIEICGTIQTREQWLDPVSYATLVTTAALTREICDRNGFDLRVLTVDETRAAYYGKDYRPTGITDHGRVTAAYPEDGGDHTDVGADFPWDVFMDLVLEGNMGLAQADIEAMAQANWNYYNAPPGPNGTAYNFKDHLVYAETDAKKAREGVEALEAKVDQILALLQSGGGPSGLVPHAHTVATNTGGAIPTE